MEEPVIGNEVLSLLDSINITKFSKYSYLVSSKEQNLYVKINHQTYNLLMLFDGERSIKDIIDTYNNMYVKEENALVADYNDTIFKLISLGFFREHPVNRVKTSPSYIQLRLRLFPSAFVAKCVTHTYFLLQIKTIIISILVSIVIWLLCSFFVFQQIDLSTHFSWWKFTLIFFISSIFHELGHSASASFFGAKNGEIGCGFYFFQFVLYSEITDVWRLPKKERVIVDIAGVYFEIIFSSVVLFVGVLASSPICIISAWAILCSCLFNLNPFIRTDGFWLFCDLINEPNVFNNIWKYVNYFTELFKNKDNNIQISHAFVAIYGLTCYAMTASFVVYMVSTELDSIIKFPINIIHLILGVCNDGEIYYATFFALLRPAIFYLLLFNFCKHLYLKLK
ncbi:MAG: M50 family metallopeptidase [Paludibacteraceae bacterium]|nr:M50 family metallopeptidase [Paludibacteraceae bacterium]